MPRKQLRFGKGFAVALRNARAQAATMVLEMEIHLVPILLGAGERLFEGVTDLGGLRPVRTVAAPNVTHLKFAKR